MVVTRMYGKGNVIASHIPGSKPSDGSISRIELELSGGTIVLDLTEPQPGLIIISAHDEETRRLLEGGRKQLIFSPLPSGRVAMGIILAQ